MYGYQYAISRRHELCGKIIPIRKITKRTTRIGSGTTIVFIIEIQNIIVEINVLSPWHENQ